MNIQYTDCAEAPELIARYGAQLQTACRDDLQPGISGLEVGPCYVAQPEPRLLVLVTERTPAKLRDTTAPLTDANDYVTELAVNLLDIEAPRLLARVSVDEIPLALILDTFNIRDIAHDFDRHSLGRSEAFSAVRVTSMLAEPLQHAQQHATDFTIRVISRLCVFDTATQRQEHATLELLLNSMISFQPSRFSFLLMSVAGGYSPVLVGQLHFRVASNSARCVFKESPTYAGKLAARA